MNLVSSVILRPLNSGSAALGGLDDERDDFVVNLGHGVKVSFVGL